ncbi:MAG: hypothetical protein LBT04_00870 [Prevotellaceae bacterium]|jgi:hypothetical protein|nr:hypothetical protein [Prevotellaceae bacterium]
MNNKKLIYNILILIFIIVSCNGKNRNKVVESDFVQTSITDSSLHKNTQNNTNIITKQEQLTIWGVLEKMKKQKKLTQADYDCICDFLFKVFDKGENVEGEEGIGYQLFEYLKGNALNNSAFLSYLNGKETKEKVLKALIQIMDIDISYEYTSYNTFIKDFSMFGNSISAKSAFNECMSNQ